MLHLLNTGAGETVTETATILEKVGEFIQTNSVYLFVAVAVVAGVYFLVQLMDRKKKKRR